MIKFKQCDIVLFVRSIVQWMSDSFLQRKLEKKKKKMLKFHFAPIKISTQNFTYNDSAINRIHIVFVQINLLEKDDFMSICNHNFENCLSLYHSHSNQCWRTFLCNTMCRSNNPLFGNKTGTTIKINATFFIGISQCSLQSIKRSIN